MRYLALFLFACGHAAAPPPPAPRATPSTVEAQPAAPDDPIVARVNGAPVYGSCVSGQASNLHLDLHAALDQCIAFELLAQAADQQGLRDDPAVVDAWRGAMVRKLLDADLGKLHTLSDLPPDFARPFYDRLGGFTERPEERLAHWARAIVPCDAAPGSAEDVAAQTVAQQAYESLAQSDGVLPDELAAAMAKAAAGTGVQTTHSDQPFRTPPSADVPGTNTTEEFRQAVYGIPKIGMVAPPFRSQYVSQAKSVCGYDVVLWWDTAPAADMVAPAFERARQLYFVQWSDRIAQEDGITPQVDRAAVDRAFGGGAGSGSASGSAP